MGKLLSMESPVGRWVGKVCDLFFLNVLCVICCIPVFTVTASVSALYSVTLKLCRDEEGNVVKDFFQAFRRNFGQSVAITAVWFFSGFLVLLMLYLYNHIEMGAWGTLRIIMYLALAVHFVWFSYVFPLFARFENTVKNTLKNAYILAVRYPLNTAVVVIINAIPFLLAFAVTELFVRIGILWVLIGFAAEAYWNSILLRRIFDQFEET